MKHNECVLKSSRSDQEDCKMEKNNELIYQVIQKLIGLHRQLLEKIRTEREALVAANINTIEETTHAKEALLESIRHEESKRLKITGDLAIAWKKPLRELTLPNIIIEVQATNLKDAELLRSAYNTLTFLIQRIEEQNLSNLKLVEASLEHVNNMKQNVLGESNPHANTYTPQGQKTVATVGSRLLSKEV
jgi:hypothetical protein